MNSPSSHIAPIAEKISFDNGWPCRLRTRSVPHDELPFHHYAPTLEIVLVEGVRGVMYVGSECYETREDRNDAFFIAPNVVHYSRFFSSPGKIHTFKISLEHLSVFMNPTALLATRSHTLFDLPAHPACYDELSDILLNRISYDGDGFTMLRGVIDLFSCLENAIPASQERSAQSEPNEKLCRILTWTEEHFRERITVEDAARILHYSKYHFCRFFRESVGVSYLSYLNTLKIQHAAKLLKDGHSATYCCYECGFSSLTYFIRLFKEISGCTTREYVSRFREQ